MLRAIRQPKSTENAPLLLAFSAAELPTQPGPPSPNIVQSWPRDEAQGRASWSGWRDAAAARPAASGASRRLRSSCRLLARPPGASLASPAAPSRRLRAAALTAPAHKSRLPTPSLPPARLSPPPPPPLLCGGGSGLARPRTPRHSARTGGGRRLLRGAAHDPEGGRPRPGPGDRRLSIPGACTWCAGGGREARGGEFLIP